MWNSRTLRGVVAIILTVQIAETTSHSGCFGGIIPPPLLLMNTLLSDRIENSQTGEIFAPPSLLYEPSEADIMSAKQRVDLYGADVLNANWIEGASPLQDATATPTYDEIVEILMRNNYGSSLAVVGIDEDVVSFTTNFLREYLNDTVIIACTNNIMCWFFFIPRLLLLLEDAGFVWRWECYLSVY